jgi:hypothetical protein
MAYFDDLLEQVEEADREVMMKYPTLAHKINENDRILSEWENWKAKEYDPSTGYTKRAVQALRDKDAEIEALKLLQGNDMTWDEMKSNVEKLINDNLTGRNYVDPSGVDSRIGGRTTIKVKNPDGTERDIPVTDYVRNVERGMEFTYAKTAHLPLKYYKEFHDVSDAPEFTQEALFKHMQEHSIADFEKGYESFVRPLREKKNEAAGKIREEQIRTEERKKVEAEYMQRNGGIMPDDTKGSAPEMSALSRKIADRKKVEVQGPKLTPGTIGDGSAGNDAYQQWLKDQASGTKPSFPQGMIQ